MTCWICGKEIDKKNDVGYGIFKFVAFEWDGEKEKEYCLCALHRNVIYGDMRRDRINWKKGKKR